MTTSPEGYSDLMVTRFAGKTSKGIGSPKPDAVIDHKLAEPRGSASNTFADIPLLAAIVASAMAVVVFPVPPLRFVTVMIGMVESPSCHKMGFPTL